MDNPGLTLDEQDDKKRLSELSAKSWLSDNEMKYEPLRYSVEKKALEALDSCLPPVEGSLVLLADKPYAGMGKEDLMRFSQTPFWNRFRLICTILFWLAWAGLLGAVIGLVVTYPQCKAPAKKPWYETAVIYQIYVRSFYDGDADGVGDINGIRSKLDYLASIYTDAILLSSIYKSHSDECGGKECPADYGYEVTNHTDINSEYGTMEDFEALLTEAHDRDIKVIMDFIPNYTGSEHPWFEASKKSNNISNPYWNYYVWADCDEQPPNNWLSVYSESVWSASVNRGPGPEQCYLHQFLASQPELNLRSSAVQDELKEILRFWLNKGVDGFRVIKVMHLFEDADLRNEPKERCNEERYQCYEHIYTTSQKEIYPLVASWRQLLDEYTNRDGVPRILLTDAMDNITNSLRYYGNYGPDGAHLPLNYGLTQINTSCDGQCMYDVIDAWLYGTPAYGAMNWMTGTQDLPRMADFIPQQSWNDWGPQNAIVMLKMTLPGVTLVYYGEEIGMTSVNKTESDGSRDPAGNFSLEYSRDPYRSPMQWTSGPNGGFINETVDNSTLVLEPWLPVGENVVNISVEAQNETYTPFVFYSELAELRRTSETFHVGNFHYALLTDDVISYYREYEGRDRYLTAINFGSKEVTIDIARSHYDVPGEAEVVMTTRAMPSLAAGDMADLKGLTLKPGDGVIVKWAYVRPDGKLDS